MTTEPVDDRPPAAGPSANLIAAVVVIALGAAAVVGAAGLGSGPGTWPMVIGVALVILGLALAVQARRAEPPERFTRSSLLVVAAVTSMIAYVAVIATIGFEIPTVLLAFAWLRFLGRESLRTSIAVSLGIVVVFYALFVGALDVTIPHLF
ncbi:tripartite tricarboxylate transporter TctB family protein [Actinoplanes sichuanensis]|uniref:Tripartite tricarboxylate transporter TctB family protein n=1 Tax=Actinoplanes sichuanensis TaxID=512349 RepID=A0ABW4AUE7_9ACTN|nr:tripartite tricarboxylate transporter TctB family protein [Actinoplanes sichuanensis]BEL08511.1 tripartite tricarboxylate transporter TctB family protein [Actinoplanes sichuanensis]